MPNILYALGQSCVGRLGNSLCLPVKVVEMGVPITIPSVSVTSLPTSITVLVGRIEIGSKKSLTKLTT